MLEHEVLKDLFFIERGYLNGNHFVYRSESPVLIDTGYASGFEETERRIAALGVNLSDISLIINTHTHCDHIGGNKRIQERSDCDIALHGIGKYFIETGNNWATWSRYFNQEADFFRCTRDLADGDKVFVGPYAFEVMYTPGHASDGIVLYNRENKLLLSSDTLWEKDMALMNVRIEGSTALFRMQESLKRIENLDVDRVYPGHGRPFSDMKGAITRGKDRLAGFFRHPEKIGEDLIKKIIVYTLMMKETVNEADFFPYLMNTHWFKETVDLFFSSNYESIYHDIMNQLIHKTVVTREKSVLSTSIKP